MSVCLLKLARKVQMFCFLQLERSCFVLFVEIGPPFSLVGMWRQGCLLFCWLELARNCLFFWRKEWALKWCNWFRMKLTILCSKSFVFWFSFWKIWPLWSICKELLATKMLHMCVSEDNKNMGLQKRHVRWRKSNFQFAKNYYHMKIHGKFKQQKNFF